jgi:hypothetical protein
MYRLPMVGPVYAADFKYQAPERWQRLLANFRQVLIRLPAGSQRLEQPIRWPSWRSSRG